MYYNINQEHFYMVYTRYDNFKYHIGYINQFNHILVQMFYVYKDELYNITSHNDIFNIFPKKEKLRNRVITRVIRGLYKLKK